jgi:hypothetical protein
MSTHEARHPLDRRTAEALVRPDRHGDAGQPALAALLAATVAPARAGELGGEAAALAAFRAAQHAPVPRRRRLSMLKTTLAKLLTVKIGALCVAALGVGGVAVAASTGNLPDRPWHSSNPPASAKHQLGARPSGTPSVRPSHPQTLPPGLVALCRNYIGRDADHRRRSLDEPGFHDLIGPAGGKDRERVDRFCDKLIHDWPSGAPSGAPSRPDPGQHPTTRPSGDPHFPAPSRSAPAPSRPGSH